MRFDELKPEPTFNSTQWLEKLPDDLKVDAIRGEEIKEGQREGGIYSKVWSVMLLTSGPPSPASVATKAPETLGTCLVAAALHLHDFLKYTIPSKEKEGTSAEEINNLKIDHRKLQIGDFVAIGVPAKTATTIVDDFIIKGAL